MSSLFTHHIDSSPFGAFKTHTANGISYSWNQSQTKTRFHGKNTSLSQKHLLFDLFQKARFGQEKASSDATPVHAVTSPLKREILPKKSLTLLILDGWGLRTGGAGNAVEKAKPLFYQSLLKNYPWIPLDASNEAVGLPSGNPGNSEVGHMTLGAGRIFFQDLPKINKAIAEGTFDDNAAFMGAVNHVAKTGGTLHLMGLASDGGVHSHLNHLLALIDFAKRKNVKNIRVHAFLDGRDTPPKGAKAFLEKLEAKLRETGYPQITTLSGRYFAMDRDKRWDRTVKTYDNMVSGSGKKLISSVNALEKSYEAGKTDEFVEPVVTDPFYKGMNDGDGLIFFNYRPDRARQITQAISAQTFDGFQRKKTLQNLYMACMTSYDDTFNLPVAFPKDKATNVLSEILSRQGFKQFHTAETEKYAHVTYFFNGGTESAYPGEDRQLVPSPKVDTYDLKPDMSIKEVTEQVINAVESEKYDFIVANFANPDMVGHTGKESAAIEAVKSVDAQLKRMVETILKKDSAMLLTADHGNIETMVDDNGEPHTAHTSNPVPFIFISNHPKLKLVPPAKDLGLSNVAPTILDLYGIPKPAEMTAKSLLNRLA